MKLNTLVFPLVVALAAAFTTTGCKHKSQVKVTDLPHRGGGAVGNANNSNRDTLPAGGQPIDMGQTKPFSADSITPGSLATAPFDLYDYNQDRAALAAYTVHFKFDSAVVQDSEAANVTSVGQALTSDPTAKLLIEGHCDERGTEEYNRALGERRALALRETLARDGVDPMRVKTISYGKDKPADEGHDETAWAKNRRGEFILLHAKSTPLVNN